MNVALAGKLAAPLTIEGIFAGRRRGLSTWWRRAQEPLAACRISLRRPCTPFSSLNSQPALILKGRKTTMATGPTSRARYLRLGGAAQPKLSHRQEAASGISERLTSEMS